MLFNFFIIQYLYYYYYYFYWVSLDDKKHLLYMINIPNI